MSELDVAPQKVVPDHYWSKFTPEARAKIIEGLEQNLPQELAAYHARIAECTFYAWRARGIKELEENITDSEYAKFYLDIISTRAKKVIDNLDKVSNGEKNWQGRAWILERCYRKFFALDAGIIAEIATKISELETRFSGMHRTSPVTHILREMTNEKEKLD